VRVIFPAEGDALAVEGHESMMGDGQAVGVTAQIPEHLARAAESGFGIDDPNPPVEAAQQLAELLRIGECGGRSGAT
jgi:hypothetical protein